MPTNPTGPSFPSGASGALGDYGTVQPWTMPPSGFPEYSARSTPDEPNINIGGTESTESAGNAGPPGQSGPAGPAGAQPSPGGQTEPGHSAPAAPFAPPTPSTGAPSGNETAPSRQMGFSGFTGSSEPTTTIDKTSPYYSENMAPPVSFAGDEDWQLYNGPLQDLPRSQVISSMGGHYVPLFVPSDNPYNAREVFKIEWQEVRTTVSIETDWVQVACTMPVTTNQGKTEIDREFTIQLLESFSTTWTFGANATANIAFLGPKGAIQLLGSRGFTTTSGQQNRTPIPIEEKLDPNYLYTFMAVAQRQRVRVVETYEGGSSHGRERRNYFYELQSNSSDEKATEVYNRVGLQVFRRPAPTSVK